MGLSIRFLGATSTVTGSRYLVATDRSKVLVEAGLYQGRKDLRERNWEPLPVPPSELDAVVVTHAHIDHVGYVPALTLAGFDGAIHATEDTTALASIVLPDSGHLQEEEAEYANRTGSTRHRPARPLYTEDDARWALPRFTRHAFGSTDAVTDDLEVCFRPAGHILGSAHVQITTADGVSIVFSGDLGGPGHPLLVPPARLPQADALVIESTYGDRSHGSLPALLHEVAEVIHRCARTGGVVVIPAFAVDRTEVVLHHLEAMTVAGLIPQLPVFVDSPMALAALGVYRTAVADGHDDVRTDLDAAAPLFQGLDLREVRTVEGSKSLNANRFPSIIVSASGMATGGRVIHHLAHHLGDPDSAVVLPGFQAEGTRGRRLLDGEPSLKIFGHYVRVRARVVDATAISSHADRGELRAWVEQGSLPGSIFVVHGEPPASAALQRSLGRLDVPVAIPSYGERVLV